MLDLVGNPEERFSHKEAHIVSSLQLENSAIGLWNFSVTLKTKGTISAASNAKSK